MLRRGPFLVDLFMAFATLRSGGIEGEGLLVDRGDGSFFAFRGFCFGSSLFVLLDKSFERGVRIGFCGRFLFWASLTWAVLVCFGSAASLDAATAFWLRNAAFISMALAKAQESIEIPDNRFTASPFNRFQGGIPICIAREKDPRPASLDRCAGLLSAMNRRLAVRTKAILGRYARVADALHMSGLRLPSCCAATCAASTAHREQRLGCGDARSSLDPVLCRRSQDPWHHIAPGKPAQNAFVESFNGQLRDELLAVKGFFGSES